MQFEKSLQLVIAAEGGYTLHYIPGDSGGLTYTGIALKPNPTWKGWETFLRYAERATSKRYPGYNSMTLDEKLTSLLDFLPYTVEAGVRYYNDLQKIAETNGVKDFVPAIYRAYYWNACKLDDVPDLLRYPIFSCAVNCGARMASKFLQRALGITDDGIIGNITTKSARTYRNTASLLNDFYTEWAKYYDSIVAKRPDQAKFLAGWKNRIEAVKKSNQ